MPDESPNRDLFAVETPLGFVVRVGARYWATIVSKHPDLADRLADVQSALREPEEDGDGFLVTAYRTDAIKEGERLWPK